MLQRSISSTATLVPEDYDVEAQIASLERKTISHNSSARTSTETLHEGEKNREEKAGPQSDEPILITWAADDRSVSHPIAACLVSSLLVASHELEYTSQNWDSSRGVFPDFTSGNERDPHSNHQPHRSGTLWDHSGPIHAGIHSIHDGCRVCSVVSRPIE